MQSQTLQDLFLAGIADMYYAERELAKALPELAECATHDELREALEIHSQETEAHAQHLEEIFHSFGVEAETKKCHAIIGLLKEARELMADHKNSPTLNAALVFAAQKAEHYEIASYGSLREWARLLGRTDIADVLEDILQQEKAADARLSEIAEDFCNPEASVDDESVLHGHHQE